MKLVKQVGIIWAFTMAGEFLHTLLPLPVPAGVYGLFLLLGALLCGLVKLDWVEGTGGFLLETMAMMFIPAIVGLIEYADAVRAVLVPFAIIIAGSTLAVMLVTGWLAQLMLERGEKGAEGKEAGR